MAFNLEDYETVEERLIKFWKEYPDGRIETEIIEASAQRFVVSARLYRTEADSKYWTSGHAFEVITERGVNATSALENCETSAIGRALANAGFATRGKRASREEMAKVSNRFEKRVENFTRETVPVEKPSDAWTIEQKQMPVDLDEALTQLNEGIKPEEIPMCKHGARVQKQGVGKTNKPFFGYVCAERERINQCEPLWYVMDKSGRWIAPKPAVEQGAL
jgi:rubrerythrin